MSDNALGTVEHGSVTSGEAKMAMASEKTGTVADQRDMYRMGKSQKLRVDCTSFELLERD